MMFRLKKIWRLVYDDDIAEQIGTALETTEERML